MSGTLRADLADVAPMYYPVVEQQKFGSLKAMCKRLGLSLDEVDWLVQNAAINQSDFVPLPGLALGDAALNIRGALVAGANGQVMLCACFFGEASYDKSEVVRWLHVFAANEKLKGKSLFVADFRPNPALGAMQ